MLRFDLKCCATHSALRHHGRNTECANDRDSSTMEQQPPLNPNIPRPLYEEAPTAVLAFCQAAADLPSTSRDQLPTARFHTAPPSPPDHYRTLRHPSGDDSFDASSLKGPLQQNYCAFMSKRERLLRREFRSRLINRRHIRLMGSSQMHQFRWLLSHRHQQAIYGTLSIVTT